MNGLQKDLRPHLLVTRLALVFTWSFTLVVACGMGLVLFKAHEAYEGKRAYLSSGSMLLSSKKKHVDVLGASGKKVAIIIDGLGSDMGVARRIFKMKIPVTLAVLPYRRHSSEIARRAFDHGKEVLLQLPMQPYDYPAMDPGAGCLMLSMDRTRVQSELDAQIASLPFCVGIHPYMGSLFTERRGPMGWVFSVLRERGLFFVDGLATPASVSQEVAESFGVNCFHRPHVLDESREVDYIVRQLCQLADFAAVYGRAVGIGHPYPETLAALPKALAAFREKGVDIVLTSKLFSSPHRRAGGPLFEETG